MRKGMLPILGMAVVLAVAGSPALAGGDADAGKKLYNSRCKMCHDVRAGKHRSGPSLFGVVDRLSTAEQNQSKRRSKTLPL